MCGIAGVIHADRHVAMDVVGRMNDAQRHRGPDDSGREVYPFGSWHVALGQRRLAILDLSPLGHQPMVDVVRGDVLIFNGEIYNYVQIREALEREGHTFRSSGDTEVLLRSLAVWGVRETLQRLEGMFAFAFLERSSQRLTLARDPLGIKPLYFAKTMDHGLVFASEVRAVLNSGIVARGLDRRGLAGYLAYGAMQHPFTMFDAIRSLAPGSFQQFTASDSGWRAEPAESFWKFPSLQVDWTEAAAIKEVQELVTRAVREHMIADVPVGVFLSAGIDSSIVAAVASTFDPTMTAFTVGFSDHADVSELELARATAKQLGMNHFAVNITAEEAETAAVRWLASMDQPSIDGLNTFIICDAVRKQGIKVVLSGLGADELFGGYPSFRDVPRIRTIRRSLCWVPAAGRRACAYLLALRRSRMFGRKLSDMLGSDGKLTSLYFHRRRLLSNQEMQQLGMDWRELGLTSDYQDPSVCSTLDVTDDVRAIAEMESRFYQGNMLLRDSDVMSMAHGQELRVPFLDRRLLDRVHSMPASIRAPHGASGKHLLRQAFQDRLPVSVLNRPKTGFTLPIERWMRTSLRSHTEAAVRQLSETNILARTGVESVREGFIRENHAPTWSRWFALSVLGSYWGEWC